MMRVAEVCRIPGGFVRAELEGAALAGIELVGAPDEACVFHFPLDRGGHDPMGRWYTLRAVSADRTRATVDVLCHDGGVGAAWARRAAVGDRIGVSRASSWFRRPVDAGWQVLVGDAAAMPAIARIAQESPDLPTEVVADLADGAEPYPMPDGTSVRTRRAGQGGGLLAELVEDLDLPDGPGYVYVGGEAAGTRAARKNLRHVRGLGNDGYGVLGYWRRDADRFRKKYEAAPERFAQAWADAEARGAGDEERVLDLYETSLAEAGLL